MRKFLTLGILAGLLLFLPHRSRANPMDLPTGGGWIPAPINASANGYFTFTSTYTITLTTPTSSAYQYCLAHLVARSASDAGFTISWATSTAFSPSTTDFSIYLTTLPYDTQWSEHQTYCSPPGALLRFTPPSVSTYSVEGFTFKGWNP